MFKQENIMLQFTFNPGLTLTGFRTTRPRILNYSKYSHGPFRRIGPNQ